MFNWYLYWKENAKVTFCERLRRVQSHIKEFEEGDMRFFGSIQVLFVPEEKKVCEGSIDEVRVFPADWDQVESFPPWVPSFPEQFRELFFPRCLNVGLDGHHVQGHAPHGFQRRLREFVGGKNNVRSGVGFAPRKNRDWRLDPGFFD